MSCTVNDAGYFDCPPLDAPVRLFDITGDTIEDIALAPFAFTQMILTDLAIRDGVLIAVGKTFDEREALVWLSADARTWVPADISAEQLAENDLIQPPETSVPDRDRLFGPGPMPGPNSAPPRSTRQSPAAWDSMLALVIDLGGVRAVAVSSPVMQR